ncbi:citrulline utilization hydrolase CtlX [Sediminibacterium ginsengisoli]|uniref:Amidinotransferase n=1 Tax=Sediminibacterium ginsengisoli TaxID=413434 RepID=A0A1T4PP00_9BACT|nr:arginine deiminase-related protein [Sediminibacterium ginsengisoli]SJZ93300.1 hypothetical protein SAMN04488132_106139 [Sediminibacterium ginsengisoli]
MQQQHTSHILMIRPAGFGFNPETAVNNSFQVNTGRDAQEQALKEFDDFVALLRSKGIDILAVQDTPEPHTPDSIFPNNWISFHDNGQVILYPMFAENRRRERKQSVIQAVQEHFSITEISDLSPAEQKDLFLEGTGSMVLDRTNRISYACISPRTNPALLQQWCEAMKYTAVPFTATDRNGNLIYHTNVMMCVADKYAIICTDTIADLAEREQVLRQLEENGKKIITISLAQMDHFAGNMLQVHNKDGQAFLVMSSQAYHSLDAEQVAAIEAFDPIIHSPIPTIETNGGGSARCMMAEIFLPAR